ncbi:type II toxin-antitoxin system prevent-host-death family antitoxin [Sulfurimonas sp. SAG-AH-194-L11]|nr:type II toxin-antitoxin system prevent-host-death family antitoxin [Sulfurimonas sp. SAG-AH-194-L11]MDF1877543.1 type II toxin-antitoxin system prevent-host-death family antitoxin [Sulfurimonas sp. SAG-AH-194-L11]
MTVTANDVKQRGVSLFGELLEKFDEIVVNVRGKKKYVVMDIERYKRLRALELDEAYREVMADVANGEYHTNVEKHLLKIANV